MWAGVPSEPLCLHTQSLATAHTKSQQHILQKTNKSWIKALIFNITIPLYTVGSSFFGLYFRGSLKTAREIFAKFFRTRENAQFQKYISPQPQVDNSDYHICLFKRPPKNATKWEILDKMIFVT
eukprot:TRINITY_DN6111_c0_g1_i3.p3 TRINITY_DN6111_c0_g1~~TRINITY_DN6111_c0_g1_i3.p3  ORF type:complete len:124 (-),score=3.72 TRINITY_DN6111_c0_g1_i3:42-413(-)